MKTRHYGEPVTVWVRVSGPYAEDVFYPIVNALKRENRLRRRDGYAPLVFEVETEETAAGTTAAEGQGSEPGTADDDGTEV